MAMNMSKTKREQFFAPLDITDCSYLSLQISFFLRDQPKSYLDMEFGPYIMYWVLNSLYFSDSDMEKTQNHSLHYPMKCRHSSCHPFLPLTVSGHWVTSSFTTITCDHCNKCDSSKHSCNNFYCFPATAI